MFKEIVTLNDVYGGGKNSDFSSVQTLMESFFESVSSSKKPGVGTATTSHVRCFQQFLQNKKESEFNFPLQIFCASEIAITNNCDPVSFQQLLKMISYIHVANCVKLPLLTIPRIFLMTKF